MSSGLFLVFLFSTGFVGSFAVLAWRTKSTIIAGQRYMRDSSPRTYWAVTSFWTVAFAFMVYLLIEAGFAP